MQDYSHLVKRSVDLLTAHPNASFSKTPPKELSRRVKRQIGSQIKMGRVPGYLNHNLGILTLVDEACGSDQESAKFIRDLKQACRYDNFSPWRRIDGRCNNKMFPLRGSALIPMRRYLPARYQDGMGAPVTGAPVSDSTAGRVQAGIHNDCQGRPYGPLPNARAVSAAVHGKGDRPENVATHMVAIMGQFLDHDITLTPEIEVHDCCGHPNQEDCLTIDIPRGDTFFSKFSQSCLDFTRSVGFCQDKNTQTKREQINSITAFVDASNVYGSDLETSRSLRTLKYGLLKTSTVGKYEMLPIIDGTYKAGDIRAMENPALASMHTLWVREHNRIAKELRKRLKKSRDDETVFQMARKLVIAEMQNVVYGQYLGVLLSPKIREAFGLEVTKKTTAYNSFVDPSIKNSFATAAYRFGHSMIQGLVEMMHEQTGRREGDYRLKDSFFHNDTYKGYGGAGMEKILKGLLTQRAQKADRFMIEDVTNHLFEADDNRFGMDLVARNIQRGRDHGIPSYNAFRQLCELDQICSWADRPAEIDPTTWQKLQGLYEHPNDIDLFVGGMAERTVDGAGLTGYVFQWIKALQFRDLMVGDRYFFAHESPGGGVFTPGHLTTLQLENLRTRNLGDIICDNTKIGRVKKDVFRIESPTLDCSRSAKIDFDLFT